jgi:hypothetical protein
MVDGEGLTGLASAPRKGWAEHNGQQEVVDYLAGL